MDRVNGHRKRILVVEDSDPIRNMITAMLAQYGFEILEAGNGAEALQLIDHQQRVDLVVTDIIMPQVGGIELAEHLGRIQPGVPVLFMSGYTDDPVIRDIERNNGCFLAKPFTASALSEKVQQALGIELPHIRDCA